MCCRWDVAPEDTCDLQCQVRSKAYVGIGKRTIK